MHGSRLRIRAFIVLALLGAPVAMHVVMHDLHDHHDDHEAALLGESGHGDHEHPIVSSSAPQLPPLAQGAFPATIESVATAVRTGNTITHRDVLSFGALRIDDDVGPQALLSTFLI